MGYNGYMRWRGEEGQGRPSTPLRRLGLCHRDRDKALPGSIEVADAGDEALVVDVARMEAGPARAIAGRKPAYGNVHPDG